MTQFPLDKFQSIETPFYYYDMELLRRTLKSVTEEMGKYTGYAAHYAVKANANKKVLQEIARFGLGADCVSGNEIKVALNAGFPASKIVYAGVAKTDKEILCGIDNDIFCFNCESIEELHIIQQLAAQRGKTVRICFRINPNIGAHTHANITTGLAENKFGIALSDVEYVINVAQGMPNIEFTGLHFHIGSQILDMNDFRLLSERINQILDSLEAKGITVPVLDVGGGLGIDYENPDGNPVPDFKAYLGTYAKYLHQRPGQEVHIEPGRAIVGQMGSLIARTIYVKQGATKKFLIVDAGMTELIRPALYGAYHKVDNLTANAQNAAEKEKYDVVGPICESSDVFVQDYMMPTSSRGDIIAFRSAGAYGETMASQYNCRSLPASITSDELFVNEE